MGAIIMCSVIIALGIGMVIFDHTEAGRRFLN
jgi:hypothetical protein